MLTRAGYYWPKWVMGPWGAVLLAGTVNGLMFGGGGQSKSGRKAARRQERDLRRGERRGY
ncbi:hypothetical protein HC028_09750 [Planosporangium flavigriseum]|uniref:Uncharacterized protein n=1 Tax=Planosporangium flavigriseum TaxID=373681 RepID=A0A8J3LRJ1_9ACTN|nr:hypothetical protein [Planosporangium flavigriseum]NJC64783.1 hypothetical protein [Planosporangium flavigriseum]GIG72654.1 hypothetical protein Pfl04_10580 [Planosporangium flavigriseum]